MKKLFLFLMACCLTLTMSAKVAYLLPNGCAYNGPVDNDENADISGLPSENMDGVNQDPEWRAAQWFYDEYVKSGKGEFVAVADFGTKYSQFSTIWIHLDRENAAEDVLSYYNNDSEFLTHLKAFTAGGGNLLLSKHASQLLGDGKLNRLVRPETIGSNVEQRFSPEYPRKSYDWNDGETKWFVSTKFNGRDNSTHPVFNTMLGGFSGNSKDVECLFVASRKHHTDFNCGIPRDWIHVSINDKLETTDSYEVQKSKVDKFEEVCKCRIIGVWGGNEWMQYGGFVEFYPKGDDFKGTIMMYGLAAYNWCKNNEGYGYENVQRMTRNGINYLENTPNGKIATDTKLSVIFGNNDFYPTSLATTNSTFRTIHPMVDNWAVTSWIPNDQTGIAEIMNINGTNKLVFKKEGTVTLHTAVTEDRADQVWPKGTYEYTHNITFTYSSSAQAVADADLSSNGLDGSTGKFMVLHKNMRGLDSLAYTISFDGIEEANRAEVRKVQDGEYTRLVFDKAGTVKLNIRLNEPNYSENWAKGEHNVVKTVTFAQPAFTWTREPGHAAITEDKDPAQATCSVPGTTVKYESDNTEIASIDAETGKITYIKAGTCNIYAYIEINGVKYRSDAYPLTVNAPTFQWNTCPEEMKKGEVKDIEAVVKWITATVTYDISGPATIADGKITATGVGTVTVTPKTTINEQDYFGEAKTVEVKPDLKWEIAPQSAFVGELNKVAKATSNEGTVVYSSSDDTKVSVDSEGNLTFLGYDEACVITIYAKVTIDGTTYSIEGNVNANLPNVMWTTEPAANAYVGQTLDIAAQLEFWEKHAVGFETTNCTYADGQLTITAGETATVRPYVELTTANKKYYGAEKSITITTPVVTWTHEPDEAAVMEDKPAAQAKCNIDKLTVYYRSLNTDVATIDAETGKISYLKPSGIEGSDPYGTVTIEAYVTIGATEYKDTKAIKIFGPKADWVTRPATTATVGDVVEIAGHVRFGAAALGFDYADEYIEYTAATETESAKITFLKAGTTTIRPYAEAYGAKYYNNETATADKMGEEIPITVAPDLKWVAGNPMSACVGETGKTAIATTTDGKIVYSSSAPEKVAVDENTGALTFLGYNEAGKVTITATVTIDGKDYSISGEIDANLPNVYWVAEKKPGTTYRLDETPAAEAKLEYGPGVVQYELSNCTWANDQLTFTAEGEATVQPYVEYDSHKYYGDKVIINVTPASEVYTRPVTPGRYGTICLERTSTALEGASFWEPEKLIKDNDVVIGVQLVEVDKLKAGYGYFFLATEQQIKVTMSLAEAALTKAAIHGQNGAYTHGMHGTFEDMLPVPDNDPNECILSNNELRYGSGNYVQDHRAYIKLSEVEEGPAAAPGRRRVTMGVNQPNVTTGVELILMDGEGATKVMLNGQIYILRAGRIYTVEGQLVK